MFIAVCVQTLPLFLISALVADFGLRKRLVWLKGHDYRLGWVWGLVVGIWGLAAVGGVIMLGIDRYPVSGLIAVGGATCLGIIVFTLLVLAVLYPKFRTYAVKLAVLNRSSIADEPDVSDVA